MTHTLEATIQQFGNCIQVNNKVFRIMPNSQQNKAGKVVLGYMIPSNIYRKQYDLIEMPVAEVIEKLQQPITVKYF